MKKGAHTSGLLHTLDVCFDALILVWLFQTESQNQYDMKYVIIASY